MRSVGAEHLEVVSLVGRESHRQRELDGQVDVVADAGEAAPAIEDELPVGGVVAVERAETENKMWPSDVNYVN